MSVLPVHVVTGNDNLQSKDIQWPSDRWEHDHYS